MFRPRRSAARADRVRGVTGTERARTGHHNDCSSPAPATSAPSPAGRDLAVVRRHRRAVHRDRRRDLRGLRGAHQLRRRGRGDGVAALVVPQPRVQPVGDQRLDRRRLRARDRRASATVRARARRAQRPGRPRRRHRARGLGPHQASPRRSTSVRRGRPSNGSERTSSPSLRRRPHLKACETSTFSARCASGRPHPWQLHPGAAPPDESSNLADDPRYAIRLANEAWGRRDR